MTRDAIIGLAILALVAISLGYVGVRLLWWAWKGPQ